MDLIATPSSSVQSLLESDLESVESLQYYDFEELDEVEYALPTRQEAPTLAEVLSASEDIDEKTPLKSLDEPVCSALQVEFLQAVSQQILHAQDRSSAGAATTLAAGDEDKLTVGTAHGHLLSFHEQTLRWVCDANSDRGAVTSLCYNRDSTRLLAGYARGLIFQYESTRGSILRRITLAGELWGILRITYAGASGLALDTGGSVWLIKFTRTLGIRSARSSCLFSGARGEVVAMEARDSRILALATLSRVIIIAGGRAAGLRLQGPADTLPVLAWCQVSEQVIVCARAKSLQWLSVNVTGSSILLRTLLRVDLQTTPLWIGWLASNLAIFDADENIRVWGDDYDKSVDLSNIEPVYASAFFKGVWTDGRVSHALCTAGASALGGVCVSEKCLLLLGRRGVVRVRPREILSRAQTFVSSELYTQALRLLSSSTQEQETKTLAIRIIHKLSERPHKLCDKDLSNQVIKICLKYKLSEELWSCLWEKCSHERVFVEALADAAVRGELSSLSPSPDYTQDLLEKLAEFEPGLLERIVASLPLSSLDPHRASVFTRNKGLWRAVGAIAAALGGSSGAMRELVTYVDKSCAGRIGQCTCAGSALLLVAADALAGRGAGGRPLPHHARPSARHDALQTLMAEEAGCGDRSPLQVLLEHDARSVIRLLEQSARDPPFAGPLAKQNRLRVARALLSNSPNIYDPDERIEILEFITGQLSSGALPGDQEVIKSAQELAINIPGERADRAWLTLLLGVQREPNSTLASVRENIAPLNRPRLLWRLDVLLGRHDAALGEFFEIPGPSTTDIDEVFDYLQSRIAEDFETTKHHLEKYLPPLISLRPKAAAVIINNHFRDLATKVLSFTTGECINEFADYMLEYGNLQGDAATVYLRNLCHLRPSEVKFFLKRHAGTVRPEDALEIVRELGPQDAESLCLEAIGDPVGALESILALISTVDKQSGISLVQEACALCARVSPTVPSKTSAYMWTRLLCRIKDAPPSLLLEAASYLPAEELMQKSCASPSVALTLVECAANRLKTWECVNRIAARERHDALARRLKVARRGLPVRGNCRRCEKQIDTGLMRIGHCARVFHATCEAEQCCGTCGLKLSSEVITIPIKNRVRSPPEYLDHNLMLFVPPRPDVEGVV